MAARELEARVRNVDGVNRSTYNSVIVLSFVLKARMGGPQENANTRKQRGVCIALGWKVQ